MDLWLIFATLSLGAAAALVCITVLLAFHIEAEVYDRRMKEINTKDLP